MICLELAMAASLSNRSSGTPTSPTFGSMVQNGKFAACAAAVRVSALNRVDLPTLGSPTIPILKPMTVSCYQSRLLLGSLRPMRKRAHLQHRRAANASSNSPRCTYAAEINNLGEKIRKVQRGQ
jgi:hypothetical protein